MPRWIPADRFRTPKQPQNQIHDNPGSQAVANPVETIAPEQAHRHPDHRSGCRCRPYRRACRCRRDPPTDPHPPARRSHHRHRCPSRRHHRRCPRSWRVSRRTVVGRPPRPSDGINITIPTKSRSSGSTGPGTSGQGRHASVPPFTTHRYHTQERVPRGRMAPLQDHLARLVRLTPDAFVVVGATVEDVGARSAVEVVVAVPSVEVVVAVAVVEQWSRPLPPKSLSLPGPPLRMWGTVPGTGPNPLGRTVRRRLCRR